MSTAAHGEFVIGNYRVGQAIGEGTFGKVRLGVHIPTDMKVAVKTLQKEKIVEQADIQRVTRQICILKILRHPNIVQLYEIIESKTDIHLIMEYAPGGELFDYIVKKKRLQETEAIGFMQQILEGVEYIHKIGIVHRDLKPQNLLFDENRRIKIVDFGLSNQYKPSEKLKTACGSPCYAAPEMIAGKRYECSGIDVWSCGIILYAMLCGYLPFEDPNTNKLYKKIMMGEYQQPKMLTPDSKEILRNILNVNPENRFKVGQVKDSRWYNLNSNKYQARGIVVGSDAIVADESVVTTMKRMGVTAEVSQIKNYIANNRHNHVTAFYYLLKKKAQKNPSILQSEREQKRSNSPLIYKPDNKKQFYIPFKRPTTSTHERDTTRVNDSFNASKIVSSIVEANKNKIISNINNPKGKKGGDFQKQQEFKLFPKHKNSSHYEPKNHSGEPLNLSSNAITAKSNALTSRSESDEKKVQFNSSKLGQKQYLKSSGNQVASAGLTPKKTSDQLDQSQPLFERQDVVTEPARKEEVNSKNKRREELSDQLKQISLKIDKEIHELRKHNNMTSSMMSQKRRESFGTTTVTQKFKMPDSTQGGNALINKTATFEPKIESEPQNKLNYYKQMPTKFPKMHFGPFNAQCLLMEAPRGILLKIAQYLDSLKTAFKEVDLFTVRLQTGETISVESIHGITGYHVVKFSSNTALNEKIVEHLAPH